MCRNEFTPLNACPTWTERPWTSTRIDSAPLAAFQMTSPLCSAVSMASAPESISLCSRRYPDPTVLPVSSSHTRLITTRPAPSRRVLRLAGHETDEHLRHFVGAVVDPGLYPLCAIDDCRLLPRGSDRRLL